MPASSRKGTTMTMTPRLMIAATTHQFCLQKERRSVESQMTSLNILSVPLIMIGMIQSKLQVYIAIQNMFLRKLYYSVRAKLCNGEPNFDMGSSFFLHCLYENED